MRRKERKKGGAQGRESTRHRWEKESMLAKKTGGIRRSRWKGEAKERGGMMRGSRYGEERSGRRNN